MESKEDELIILDETYYGTKNKTPEQTIRTFFSCIYYY
jgi:hypothetical protein